MTLTIERTGGDQGSVTVSYAVTAGTATAGSDYTSSAAGTVTFANKELSKTISMPIVNDTLAEPDETFRVTLTAVSDGALGTPAETVVTILDDDGPPPVGTLAFASPSYSISEAGGSVTLTVTRTGGSAGAVGVSYATADGTALAGSHYTATSGTLSWASGDVAAKTITVPIALNAVTGDKSFTVTLSGTTGGATLGSPSVATVTIIDDGGVGSVHFASSSYTIAQNVSPLSVTVRRTGGTVGAITVSYATADGTASAGTNYTATSGTLSWGSGDASDKTFSVPILNAGSMTDLTFTISLAGTAVGAPSSTTVTITGIVPGPGTWTSSWSSDVCVKTQHERYCGHLAVPPVTDPTDAPGDTAQYGNLPAVLADMAVGGQLGAPLKILSGSTILDSIPVRISTPEPTGLIQTFGNKIRVGLMSFNYNGSASECAAGSAIPCPNVCSNDATKTCSSYLDCCRNSNECSCNATTPNVSNADGGVLLYPVGQGTCSNSPTTACATNENCSAGGSCVMTGAGTHSSGLVNQIDSLRAANWTPFAEAFYNAIGYFARIGPTQSRTDIRGPISSIYPDTMNPSQYSCQQNYVLLISDGVPTADQSTATMELGNAYKTLAGLNGGACSYYRGSSNLPILAWLARNKKISSFTTTPSSSPEAAEMRDRITTYVVFNGQDNGVSGECNSITLMRNTANKGGGRYYQAENPQQLEAGLRSAFEEIAAKAASGTAASILSNSEGSGANILQAVFYPRKIFDNATEVNWVGEMQNLWYYVDPYIQNSTIREDTDSDNRLNLVNDYVARFAFDTSSDRTMVQLYQDTNGDGVGETPVGGLIDPDNLKSLWRAGKLLWSRNLAVSPRNILTTVDGTNLINFASSTSPGGTVASTAATLADYLNVADATAAANLINWVHGHDAAPFRNRTVTIGGVSKPWILGDIISSTPRVQSTVRLNTYNLPYPGGYSDRSYETFINSNEYQQRGMVYVGGNDGMLHAFNLGLLSVRSSGMQKASLTGSNLGREEWAFIPKNTLPYLRYLADPNYGHIYLIDGRTSIFDASIGDTNTGSCTRETYDQCDKALSSSVVRSDNSLDPAKNTWRTVLIGGMGIGGASAASCSPGTNCVPTPRTDPSDASSGLGYSSYFALDVTNPSSPSLLWEFTDPALGYATTGPAIVRIGDKNKNGKWFAVFGSGPTGPINNATNQFLGRSDQNLKYFVIDLRTGTKLAEIDTGIPNAFSGPLLGASIDADRNAPTVSGNYQDDAIYVGFVKKDTATGEWTQGGVGRILTKESSDPTNWEWSVVIDDIGPVTTNIARLQDRRELNKALWLFFGTGRYYFRDSQSLDDSGSTRALFGIKEPCYNTSAKPGNFIDGNCTDTLAAGSAYRIDPSQLVTASNNPVGNAPGWRIDLDPSSGSYGAERVVTDTVALTNGTVYFTSFKPTMDLCGYGGNSFLWGVKYDTGGAADANTLLGKVLIQLSTGEFREVDLSSAFTDKGGRRMATPMTGKPPSDAPPIISHSLNRPLKKILHIRER